jgi:hypothetical protein
MWIEQGCPAPVRDLNLILKNGGRDPDREELRDDTDENNPDPQQQWAAPDALDNTRTRFATNALILKS